MCLTMAPKSLYSLTRVEVIWLTSELSNDLTGRIMGTPLLRLVIHWTVNWWRECGDCCLLKQTSASVITAYHQRFDEVNSGMGSVDTQNRDHVVRQTVDLQNQNHSNPAWRLHLSSITTFIGLIENSHKQGSPAAWVQRKTQQSWPQ